MNPFLTTEELVLKLNNQKSESIIDSNESLKSERIVKVKKIGKSLYFVLVGVLAIYSLFSMIPMIFPNRAVNFLGNTTMLVVPNDQELDSELQTDIAHVNKFNYEKIAIGDRIIVYGKFGTDLYWMEEVVAIDEVNQTLDTTFGYFIRNTYQKNEIVATYQKRGNLFSTILYVSTTPRGFISLVIVETLVLSVVYYYFIRKPKEKK